jgi:DUF4097 and DUF4098 domain-containing protein YvlB
MPTFSTPEPIVITIDIASGDARISAGDRHDTVVDVAPRDPSREADVHAAGQTRVDLVDGRLLVRTPRTGLSLRGGSVDVTIAAPTGSSVDGRTGAGDLDGEGTLADCTFKSGAGAIRLGRTGRLEVTNGAGDITVERAGGDVTVTTGSGAVRIEALERGANIKSGNGTTTIGAADGDLRIVTANGDITVDRAAGDVVAKTAHGSVRVGEVARGSVELSTAAGNIEVGIAEGTAARLDVRTHFGSVHRQLEATDAPPATAQTVAVRGRTSFGDITVARAPAR